MEEECAGDKGHSVAYFCKAAAFLCPAQLLAAGQGSEPSHANIRKINFSPQWAQLLEQKATQAIALWDCAYFWHDTGSPVVPNPGLVLEQPSRENKTKQTNKQKTKQTYTQLTTTIKKPTPKKKIPNQTKPSLLSTAT